MNCKKLSLYVLIAVVFTSCYMARCPGFNLDDHRYVPYRYNDTLYYYSDNLGELNKQDSLVLVVVDFDSGESYEFYTYTPDVECSYEVYYQTNEIDGISIKEYVCTPNDAVIQIGDDIYPSNGLTLSNKPDTTYLHDSTYNTRIISFPIMKDNIKYQCWTMEDLTGNYRFDSFTKMEYKGIVEFHDKQTGKIWKLKD